jgi:multiple sugar transport system substrate-binding protein
MTITAVVVAVGSLLAGCTPSASSTGQGNSSDSKELTVWHYYSVDGQTAGLDALGKDFESTHDGVKVTNVYVPFDQLTNKLVQSAGTQTGPDVVVFNAADTYTLQQAGAIKPMNDWWDS